MDYGHFRIETRLVREAPPAALIPEIHRPVVLYDMVRSDLETSDRERLVVVYVDLKQRVIGAQQLAIGGRSSSLIPADAIARAAILCNASGVLLAHNHPSGDPTPSPEDVRATKELDTALRLFDVAVLDHVVVGDGRWLSLRDEGLYTPSR